MDCSGPLVEAWRHQQGVAYEVLLIDVPRGEIEGKLEEERACKSTEAGCQMLDSDSLERWRHARTTHLVVNLC